MSPLIFCFCQIDGESHHSDVVPALADVITSSNGDNSALTAEKC